MNNNTNTNNGDIRDTILKHWNILPKELQNIIESDTYISVVKNATQNMLLSREDIDQVELAVLCSLLGVLPYTELVDALKEQTHITERDRERVSMYIREHLFTPHEQSLDTLPINIRNIKKELSFGEKKQEEPTAIAPQKMVGSIEKTITGDTVLHRKFSKLTPSVQQVLLSGATELSLATITKKHTDSEEKRSVLQKHIISVLVGTETVSQFKELLGHENIIPQTSTQDFLQECESQLFRPARKVILQSLEQTGQDVVHY